MACQYAGAAQSKRPPLAIGELHPALEQLETAHTAGRHEVAKHLAAIERRITAAERKLWRAPKHAVQDLAA